MVQGLAAGGVLYVVFTELLPKARLLGGGGGGALQVAAMLGGFLLFLPVIYLREFSLQYIQYLQPDPCLPR